MTTTPGICLCLRKREAVSGWSPWLFSFRGTRIGAVLQVSTLWETRTRLSVHAGAQNKRPIVENRNPLLLL